MMLSPAGLRGLQRYCGPRGDQGDWAAGGQGPRGGAPSQQVPAGWRQLRRLHHHRLDKNSQSIILGTILILFVMEYFWEFKGTVSRDFRPYFLLKRFDLGPSYEQAKIVSQTFFIFAKIFDHKVRKSPFRVVNDYADTTRFTRISLQQRKISRNRFGMFIWGPGGVYLIEKSVENLVTLSL